MADKVKVLIVERNGVELEFQEEYVLSAENIEFDNTTNGFTATDIQGAVEENQSSASPGFSFGRSGNISAGTWLQRPGGVPSNKSGVNFGLDNGDLQRISVGSETLDTYTIEIYQHDGDLINSVLITSASVTSSRKEVLEKDTDFTISNAIQKDKHIAIKISSGSAKNLGVDLQLSGASS